MPVDYIDIIDRDWGHLYVGSGTTWGPLDRGISVSTGEDKKQDAWAPTGSIHNLENKMLATEQMTSMQQ